jgi:hypothetical protein
VLVGEFTTAGYVGLCLFGGLTYAVVALVVCLLHVEVVWAADASSGRSSP